MEANFDMFSALGLFINDVTQILDFFIWESGDIYVTDETVTS